jgi:hypothetical protein
MCLKIAAPCSGMGCEVPAGAAATATPPLQVLPQVVFEDVVLERDRPSGCTPELIAASARELQILLGPNTTITHYNTTLYWPGSATSQLQMLNATTKEPGGQSAGVVLSRRFRV